MFATPEERFSKGIVEPSNATRPRGNGQNVRFAVIRKGAGILLSVLVVSGAHAHAYAQQAPTDKGGRPPVTWVKLGPPSLSDAVGDDVGSRDPIGDLAFEPLRLALLGEFVPHPLNDPSSGCGDTPEAIGSLTGGAGGFPMQHIAALDLFSPRSHGGSSTTRSLRSRSRSPRLTLFGFSRGGCAIDAAAGGGVTLTLPIRQNTFFVLSGGAIYLPHGGPNGTPVSSTQGRADIVFAREGGRSWTVGVGIVHNNPGASVGGVF